MLVDPTGTMYDDNRLKENPPRNWKEYVWILYKIRDSDGGMKDTVFLTGFIDLKPYNK